MSDPAQTNQKMVFILDHPEDIDEYQKIGSSIGGYHVLIAATPEVCWELEKRGLSYRGIEEFYDSDALCSIGMKNYKIVENLCSEIDSTLQESIPLLKRNEFKPAMDNFGYLKILLDGLTLRIHIIQSIIRDEKPDEIITFNSDTEFQISDIRNFPFDSSENLYSLVLKSDGWTPKITRILWETPVSIDKSEGIKDRFLEQCFGILRRYPSLFFLLLGMKRFAFTFKVEPLKACYFNMRNSLCGEKALFLIHGPSWNYSMIVELIRSGYNIIYLPEKTECISTESPIDQKLRGKLVAIIHPCCLNQSIDFSHIFIERFFHILETYLRCVPEIMKNIEQQITRYHPVAFLMGEKAAFIEHIYAHIAHSHHIPVIGWQFGEAPIYLPMQVYNDLMNADAYLSYGPGYQVLLHEAPHNHFNCRIESVGSLILEELHMKKSGYSRLNKIVYVTTWYLKNAFHVSDIHPHDNVLWSYQKQILNVLGESQISTIFKLSPNQYAPQILEYIKNNQFDNITLINNERTFIDILKDTDIVICDYSSTPLIEAIAAHKTVFVLLNSPLVRKEARDLLEKRVYISEDIAEFIILISDYLNGRPVNQNPDLENTEYLEMFGVHKIDGKVAQRALKILERETGYSD